MKKVVALITKTEANMRRCRICDVAAPAMLMYQFHPGSKYHSLDLLSHRLHSNVRYWPEAAIHNAEIRGR